MYNNHDNHVTQSNARRIKRHKAPRYIDNRAIKWLAIILTAAFIIGSI